MMGQLAANCVSRRSRRDQERLATWTRLLLRSDQFLYAKAACCVAAGLTIALSGLEAVSQ
jgi:hypothetical protein